MTTNAASGEPKKLWGGAFSEKIDPLMESSTKVYPLTDEALEDMKGPSGTPLR